MKIEWDKPRHIPVTEMLYPDRGMIKWHGFLLSDHNEVMAFEQAVLEAAIQDVGTSDRNDWDQILTRSCQQKQEIRLRYHTEDGLIERTGVVKRITPTFFVLSDGDEEWSIDYLLVRQLM